MRGSQCTECAFGAKLVALHGTAALTLAVDGSFATSLQDGADLSLRDNSSLSSRDNSGHSLPNSSVGYGGAGLVLVRGAEILAARPCGFQASSSSDAEFQAVIRGARWAPGVPIYTDARELPAKMTLVNPDLIVRYLRRGGKRPAYALAHRLSIEGRCRAAPQTTPRLGVEFAVERSRSNRAGRRQMAAELLLERALRDPNFQGDFSAIAAALGWTSGPRWQDNPAIRIAEQLWLVQQGPRGI